MDIKTRIDELSEAEAKGALRWTIAYIAEKESLYKLWTGADFDFIQAAVLSDALLTKEARK